MGRPYFAFKNNVPAQVVQTTSDTKLDTWDPATYSYKQNADGIQTAFNTGSRLFNFNSNRGAQANFPATEIAAGGGSPFTFTNANSVVGPVPNTDIGFNSGAGPTFGRSSGWGFGPGVGRRM